MAISAALAALVGRWCGRPPSGILLTVGDATLSAWAGAWTDAGHYAHQTMDVRGTGDGNAVSMHGTPAAAPAPDWGWRLVLAPGDADRCTLRMFNRTPDGAEALAVEMQPRASREHDLPAPRHRDYNCLDALVNRSPPPAQGDAR